jgi:hypothetical protein
VADHPSLVELLPSGAFMINDDYNDRMVAIDPSTRARVWQYGDASGRRSTGADQDRGPDSSPGETGRREDPPKRALLASTRGFAYYLIVSFRWLSSDACLTMVIL